MERTITIGDKTLKYTLNRKNVKNINLRLKPSGEITVSAGRFVNLRIIEDFLVSKSDFILKHIQKIENLPSLKSDLADGFLMLCGKKYTFSVNKGKRKVEINRDSIELFLDNPDDDLAKTRMINGFYRQRAIEVITDLCRKAYPVFKEKTKGFPTLKFRNMKTKWGICRPQKNEITFNTRLVLLPKELSEYVVFHEFTHFSVPNHSKKFYEELEKNLPDYKDREQRFKNFVLFDFPQ